MTTYELGLDYDAVLDILAHALSNATPGVYNNPAVIHVDDMGHIVHIESGGLGSGYIEGLGFGWEDADNARIRPGAAFVPALNRVVEVDADLVVPIPATVSENFYLYLKESAGAGFVEASTTQPEAPYFGSARTKIGDTSARYLGMVKNNALGQLIQFETEASGSLVFFTYGPGETDDVMGWNAVASSTTLAMRSIGPSAVFIENRMVPASCKLVNVLVQRAGTTNTSRIGWPLDQRYNILPVTINAGVSELRPQTLRLDPTQRLGHQMAAGTSTLTLFVNSYYDRR